MSYWLQKLINSLRSHLRKLYSLASFNQSTIFNMCKNITAIHPEPPSSLYLQAFTFFVNSQVLLWGTALIIIYVLYLAIFKYFKVIMSGNYDTKLKKIGRTIPPFPNGWYIACKSSELLPGESMAIDQSGANITLFRNTRTKEVYGIHSYCAHLGANLGIGGKVMNQKCIQCPFHGWLYDGSSGTLVDYNGKEVQAYNVQYNDQMGQKGCKQVKWVNGKEGNVKLRTYHVKQMNGFIYVWIHSDENKNPEFQLINVEAYQNQMSNRGFTKHTINSHVQDIPENGADTFHFRYVHKYPITGFPYIHFLWTPQWKVGNDPDLQDLFTHPIKDIHEFKQNLYKNLVKPHQNKDYLSFANIDNYVVFPVIGKIFLFNLSVFQMGPGLVYVFFKTRFFTTLFVQYVQPKEAYKQVLYHEMYTSGWLPYWVTSAMLYGEAIQVYNDMLIWDAKKFGHKIYYKENEADTFILNWRKWFSKYYEGCKQKKDREMIDW